MLVENQIAKFLNQTVEIFIIFEDFVVMRLKLLSLQNLPPHFREVVGLIFSNYLLVKSLFYRFHLLL